MLHASTPSSDGERQWEEGELLPFFSASHPSSTSPSSQWEHALKGLQ